MISFDLACKAGQHKFEGWFASSAEFDRQRSEGLLCCPVCGSIDVDKSVMAPNIGRKGNQARPAALPVEQDAAVPVSNQAAPSPEMAEALNELAKLQNKMLENSEWVGRKFAEEARSIHYGEQEGRAIHGETSIEEAHALYEEGISVAPLPLPYVPPEAKN